MRTNPILSEGEGGPIQFPTRTADPLGSGGTGFDADSAVGSPRVFLPLGLGVGRQVLRAVEGRALDRS